MVKKCIRCGNEFKERGEGKNGKKFCSERCQIGYWMNTHYKHQKNSIFTKKCLVCGHIWNPYKKKYPQYCASCHSTNWDFGSNIPCSICNRMVFTPNIHHIDGIRENNYKENRTPLCQDCHSMIHNPEVTKKKNNSHHRSRIYKNESIIVLSKIKEYQSLVKKRGETIPN